jgi:Domain of unknown function (DUF6531)
MKQLSVVLLTALALFVLATPRAAQAQSGYYWTPAYPGYSAGCVNVGGYAACNSPMASCQSYAAQAGDHIISFVPARRLNEYYSCTVGTNIYGVTPIYLSCPAGYSADPNSSVGCVPKANQVMSGAALGGSGEMCPLPAGELTGGCSKEVSDIGTANRGEPVDVGTGNVFYQATDYSTAGPNPLRFIRYYNSRGTFYSALGANWHSNFTPHLEVVRRCCSGGLPGRLSRLTSAAATGCPMRIWTSP